jgi:hypothetical protein
MPTAGKPTNRRRVCYTNGLRQNAPVAQLDRASASGAIQKLGSPQPTPTNRCKSGSAVFLTGRSRPIETTFCGIRCTLMHTAPSAPEWEVSSQFDTRAGRCTTRLIVLHHRLTVLVGGPPLSTVVSMATTDRYRPGIGGPG